MANNPPDGRASDAPVSQVAVDESANPASKQTDVVPVSENQPLAASPKQSDANAGNGGPGAAKPVVVTVKLEETPPPPPSRSNAFWLGLTLVNIVLIVFLLPSALLKNDRVAFIVQIVTTVAAAGVFAAGLVYFKNLASSLPQRKWFKVVNIVALCLLGPVNVLRLPVVPIHPQIEPAGAKLKVDDEDVEHFNDRLRLSVGSHKVQITPRLRSEGTEKTYWISYKDVIRAVFKDYTPRWTPLQEVTVGTKEPNVEVTIRMKGGEFDAEFRENPPATAGQLPFGPKPNVNDTFIYRGANYETGGGDAVKLPYGEYEFVARKDGCQKQVNTVVVINKDSEADVDFPRLCN